MDELKEIRDLLPEQAPPSATAVQRARARLTEPAPVRRLRPRLVIPIAVAAAAVAIAATVVALPSQDAGPAREQAAAPRSAREILLVAAERADSDAAQAGRFWRVRKVIGAVVPNGPFGAAPNTYDLVRRTVVESWLSADGTETDRLGTRDAGTVPDDDAAWRADGSPTSWNIGYDTELGRDNVLTTAPADGTLYERSPLEQVVPGMTAQELRDLPTDAAALRTFLLANRTVVRDEPADAAGQARLLEVYLFNRSVMLLAETPVPPQVRAAALRLLADLGGVTSAGPVTDPLGRKGTGITFVTKGSTGADTAELVVDPATGALLSSRHVGTQGDKVVKESWTAVLSSGWTDEAPAVPSADVP